MGRDVRQVSNREGNMYADESFNVCPLTERKDRSQEEEDGWV